MKKTIIKDWTKYFLGVCTVSGMLLFSACDTNRRDAPANEYGYASDDERSRTADDMALSDTTATYDRASNRAIDGTYDENTNNESTELAPPTSRTPETTGTTPTDSEGDVNATGQNAQNEANRQGQQNTTTTNQNRQGTSTSGQQTQSDLNRQGTTTSGQTNESDVNRPTTTPTGQQNQSDVNQQGSSTTTQDNQSDINQTGTPETTPQTGQERTNNQIEQQTGTTTEQGTTVQTGTSGQQGSDTQQNTATQQETATQQGTSTQQGVQTEDGESPETYTVTDRSEYDIERLRKDFDEVNSEIRKTLRQYPGVSMRYTEDVERADYSYGTYGVQYENLTDEAARKQFQDLELRRSELHEQMRGHMDQESRSYLSADEDAAPANGYDALYEFLEEEIEYPRNMAASDIQGTMFVEIRVDENGQVSNPRIIETIETEGVRLESNELNPAPAVANETETNEQDKKAIIEELEEEVKQALLKTSGMWEPASMEGQAVSETIQLPIRFGMFEQEGVINNNR